MNCIDISLFNVSYYHSFKPCSFLKWPFYFSQTKSTLSFNSCRHLLVCFCIIYESDYKKKTQRWRKDKCWGCCILYVLDLLTIRSDNLKPSYLFVFVDILLIHALWFPLIFYESAIRHERLCAQKNSIPHSLLLYSVHVKWICVQNVDKDENTLDYILCKTMCCGLFLQEKCISLGYNRCILTICMPQIV